MAWYKSWGGEGERIPTELALKKNWQEITKMLVTAAFECWHHGNLFSLLYTFQDFLFIFFILKKMFWMAFSFLAYI